MDNLPLFPLNTVLFPGTPLHLHIFEERYKQMIGLCIQDEQPFGVTLIEHGIEALGPLAEPHRVGCTAQIMQVQHLEGGRMNILAVGQERFRILSLDRNTHPYLVGRVEAYPLESPAPPVLEESGKKLRSLVERFVQKLTQAGDTQFDNQLLPQDPILLAYLSAAILQISPGEKQSLLEVTSAVDLMASLSSIYRREIVLLEAIVSRGRKIEGSSFSSN